ncbi:MAG: hypothetical protein Q4B90_10720, partial [Eubacteriales bacterium]|nr:hypothetical protein [Eubacteriales bacterium]
MKAGKKPDGSPYKSWQRMLAVVLTVAMMFTILPSDVTAEESVHGTPNKELLSDTLISSEEWTESETQTETQEQTETEIQTEMQAQTESEDQTETQAQT